jgi:monoterpene epsilon-lactone hydrolase
MPSLRSRVFLFMLKYGGLLRFRMKRKTPDTSLAGIKRLRRKTTKAGGLGRVPADIKIFPVNIGNLYAEWILPSQANKNRVILYFHGGGYVIGSPQGHRVHVAKFVKGSGTGALVFDYRLAPEHPFPAALDDSLMAYSWLLPGIQPAVVYVWLL